MLRFMELHDVVADVREVEDGAAVAADDDEVAHAVERLGKVPLHHVIVEVQARPQLRGNNP